MPAFETKPDQFGNSRARPGDLHPAWLNRNGTHRLKSPPQQANAFIVGLKRGRLGGKAGLQVSGVPPQGGFGTDCPLPVLRAAPLQTARTCPEWEQGSLPARVACHRRHEVRKAERISARLLQTGCLSEDRRRTQAVAVGSGTIQEAPASRSTRGPLDQLQTDPQGR